MRYILAASILLFALPLAATAATSCPSLSLGSSDASVIALQKFLNNAYTNFPAPTGTFDTTTLIALKQWQKENGIVSSGTPETTGWGRVGNKTAIAMGLCSAPAVTQPASTQSTKDALIQALIAQIKIIQNQIAILLAHQTSSIPPVNTYSGNNSGGGGGGSTQNVVQPPPVIPPPVSPTATTTVIATAASCTFNNQTIAGGASVTAYQSSSVAYGSQCVSETRSCMNGTLSGSYQNISCTIATAPPPPPPPPSSGLIVPYIGTLENTQSSADWDEFASADASPTYTFGSSGLSDIRAWIGSSDCDSCAGLKTQHFRLANLDPGETYTLVIKPAYVSSAASFYAKVSAGSASIVRGTIASFTPGYQNAGTLWTIRFTAQTSDVTIEVGGGASSGANYLYFDAILTDIFKSKAYLSTFAQTAINNLGPDLSTVVQDGNATYSSYYLDAFVSLYEKTRDVSWLKKLVPYANAQLAQRDSVTGKRDYRGRLAPAWQEKSGYVWVGTTGEAFEPMVRFAADVQADATLQSQTVNGETLLHAAQVYVTAFQDAIAYHHEDWHLFDADNGTFYYSSDIPVAGGDALAGQPVAQNLTAAFMSALIYLSQFDAARNYSTEAAAYRDQVRQFADYLLNQVLTTRGSSADAYYLWHYSTYYPQIDDIGHSNFVALFMYRAYKAGIVFGQSDMQKLANTYNNFLGNDGNVIGDLIDTGSLSGTSHSIFYWHLVAPYRDDMLGKDLLALHVAHGYYLPLDTISIATR